MPENNKLKKTLPLLVVLFSISISIIAPLQAEPGSKQLTFAQKARVDQAVEREMRLQQAVGLAIGVLKNRRIVYLQAYGLADKQKNRKVSLQTEFNWASNSKPVMAVLAMQLVEQGKIKLDQDIRTYLPQFPVKAHPITTRQLLSHQSGIPHYRNGEIIPTHKQLTPEDYLNPIHSLNYFNKSPLIAKPGDIYSYSSYAYVLLSAVVQTAGQQPIADQLQNRILDPLDLTSFGLDTPDSRRFTPHPELTRGYIRNKSSDVLPARDRPQYWKHGAGGYKSNIKDFARWAQALLNQKLLKRETYQSIWRNQKTSTGQSTPYGLGFVVSGTGRKLKVSHNGRQPEATSRLVLYPGAGHGIVVLTNSNHAMPGKFSTAIYKAMR